MNLKLLRAFLCIATAPLPLAHGQDAARPQAYPDERQVFWQRTLEDARAISLAEGRPLFIAVNMDGESASERIVRERYRDPSWVAMTRPFVCLVSSVFRHAPRDYDEDGRRIPCPRLGEVTCGEHIALEPVLYDAFLHGERISPRHAVIQTDGEKSFDLFLLFDLLELDQALSKASALAPRASGEVRGRALRSQPTDLWNDPLAHVKARDHRSRLALEAALSSGATDAQWTALLDALDRAGIPASPDILRLMLVQSPALSDALLDGLPPRVTQWGLDGLLADLVRERIAKEWPVPGSVGLGQDARLLSLLARAQPNVPATRSLLLSYIAVGNPADRARATMALREVTDPNDQGRAESALFEQKKDLDLAVVLDLARAVTRAFGSVPKPPDELPTEASIERSLESLERDLASRPEDPLLLAEYGRASLDLARVRMQSGGSGIELLLQDADRWLERAARAAPRDASILLDRARASYQLSRFREQEHWAASAVKLLGPLPPWPKFAGAFPPTPELKRELEPVVAALASPPERLEALRWVGDAAARLLIERSQGDPVDEALAILSGAEALSWVAVSPAADEVDWQSLASFFAALGRDRDEFACLQEGAVRLPDSTLLRTALNDALWRAGQIELAPIKAEWIQSLYPKSGACAWFSGYAHILDAESARRDEDPARAIAAYARAEERFRQSIALTPDYRVTAEYFAALSWLGRGFAHLLVDRRMEAADCLARAIEVSPTVATARDGLDREVVDLLDGALEWRAIGPSGVDVSELCARMSAADPGNSTWARFISDTELREALRADGRRETAEGDRYLDESIRAGRKAVEIEDSEENRHALAQSCTVLAERMLDRDDIERARPAAAEACRLLGKAPAAADAPREALEKTLATLRSALGEARPRFRPGR